MLTTPPLTAPYYEARGRPALGGERFATSGMRVRGWVAFKIPDGIVLARLQFLTGHLETRTAEFTLNRE